MRLRLLIGLLLISQMVLAGTPDYRILKNYPEDRRGFNLKAYWDKNPEADYYKVRVYRQNPSLLNTEFIAPKNFFFFKMYPWRLYQWDIQAFDGNNNPLGEPQSGKDIYLESGLYPKPDEVSGELGQEDPSKEDEFQAQSYVTEDGETEVVDNPPLEDPIEDQEPLPEEDTEVAEEISPMEENQTKMLQPWYPTPVWNYQVGLGLGIASYGFNQSIDNLVDLDFSSFQFPSYHIFFNGQWNRWLAFIDYQSLPGQIDTAQAVAGGTDFSWTNLSLSAAYQSLRFNLIGPTILSAKLGFQMSDMPFLAVDSLNNITNVTTTMTAFNIGFQTQTELSDNWSLPLEIIYHHPLSSSGEGGSFEITGGQGFSLIGEIQWQITSQWITAFEGSIHNYSLDFSGTLSGTSQTGTVTHEIMNSQFKLIYKF